MSEKEIDDQTAFEVAGIPTPPDEENKTPTDLVSEAVANIMDGVQRTFQGGKEDTAAKGQDRNA